MITTKIYFNTREIAELFSVTERTVTNWRKQGLPVHHLGPRSVRFKLEEVTAWLEEYNTRTK